MQFGLITQDNPQRRVNIFCQSGMLPYKAEFLEDKFTRSVGDLPCRQMWIQQLDTVILNTATAKVSGTTDVHNGL
jgi:hypothetical protein